MPPLLLSFPFLVILTVSCISAQKTRTNSSGVEVTYPDQDVTSPAFCNPTGKKGVELQKCYEFNQTLYKEVEVAAEQREPWFNFPAESWVDSNEVDAKRIFTVVDENEAVRRLENIPFVELAAGEAETLSGSKFRLEGHKPYLVRGLYYFRETGGFTLFTKGDALLVQHDSSGSTTPKEQRTGVIVWLASEPSAVYVDCQITE